MKISEHLYRRMSKMIDDFGVISFENKIYRDLLEESLRALKNAQDVCPCENAKKLIARIEKIQAEGIKTVPLK